MYGLNAVTTQALFSRSEIPLGTKDIQEYKTHYDSLTILLESITNSKYSNRSKVKVNVVLLDMICCYRGWRHFKGLPVRGQRT